MNLDFLKMLVFSADEGSFSACARKLGKVQSAVSQGISNLEVDLNMQLFDRTKKMPTLTIEGERVYRHAKAMLYQAIEFDKAVRSICDKEETIIRIAIDSAIISPKFCSIISSFNNKFPFINLDVTNISSNEIVSNINNEESDIGIMFTDADIEMSANLCFIGNMPFSAVCHPKHELAKLKSVHVKDLISQRQVAIRTQGLLESKQFPGISTKTIWTNNYQSALSLVQGNTGWCYFPSYMVNDLVKQKKIHKLPIAFDHKEWNLAVDIITPKGKHKGPGLNWIYQNLKALLD